MTQFFLAYEAHNNQNTTNKGFRVFEDDAVTSTEIASLINRKLDEIASDFDVSRNRIIATAFNRI